MNFPFCLLIGDTIYMDALHNLIQKSFFTKFVNKILFII